MAVTDHHNFITLDENQSQKHVSVNETFSQIDASLFMAIDAIYTDSDNVPTTGSNGTRYLCITTSSIFLRAFTNGTYVNVRLEPGTIFYLKGDGKLYLCTGGGQYTEVGSGGGGGGGGETSDMNKKSFVYWNPNGDGTITANGLGYDFTGSVDTTSRNSRWFNAVSDSETNSQVSITGKKLFLPYHGSVSTTSIRFFPQVFPGQQYGVFLINRLSLTGDFDVTNDWDTYSLGVCWGGSGNIQFKNRQNLYDTGIQQDSGSYGKLYKLDIVTNGNSVNMSLTVGNNPVVTHTSSLASTGALMTPMLMANAKSSNFPAFMTLISLYMEEDYLTFFN